MRKEKQIHLDQIKEEIQSSSAMMLMSYQGLDANATAGFRKDLSKAGGKLTVVPKRVFIKAANESGVEFQKENLQGHIGVIFTEEDPVAPAKVLFEYQKDNKEKMQILGGQFEGSKISPEDVEQIAKLPGIQELRAQMVGILEAPLSGFLSLQHALLTSVMHCLENKSKKS
ncbi:MAG: 50S ribosomal protein L10 [Simkaniaceae bacterium]